MIRKIAAAISLSAILIIAGCKQDMDNTKLSPYLYYYTPVDVGHSVTYDVDSISYGYDASVAGDSQTIDTTYYQLKEVVMDTFYGNTGNICYGMGEFKRYDTTQPWPLNPQNEWYCFMTRNTFETVQFDLHFVKFTFPPIVGNSWQGNEYLPANDTIQDTYQIYTAWTYAFTSVNSPSTVNGHSFDSTALVTDINSQNAINSLISVERYATHVGMVFRQWEVIDKQDPTSNWTYPNQANGFRIFMWYHSFTP